MCACVVCAWSNGKCNACKINMRPFSHKIFDVKTFFARLLSEKCPQNRYDHFIVAARKNGTRIIHGGARKITVCSSTFYGVHSNVYCVGSKNCFSHRKTY